MNEQLILSPADLRPGDIMFGPIGGAVGLGVKLGHLALRERFRLGRVSVDHAAIVTDVDTDGARIAQAMPSGAEEVDFDPAKHWTERHAYVRLPESYAGQGEDAASIARLMVRERVRYSFASYLSLAAWTWGVRVNWLEEWINRRREPIEFHGRRSSVSGLPSIALPREAICSVFVDQAWSLTGYRVTEDVSPQAVTPGALAGQLLSRAGTTWALPRTYGEMVTARSWVV